MATGPRGMVPLLQLMVSSVTPWLPSRSLTNTIPRGILNTFGIYQTYYESGELFQASSSDLSWIGAIQACLLLLVGSVTGPIYDAGYFRTLLIIGSFMIVFGHM